MYGQSVCGVNGNIHATYTCSVLREWSGIRIIFVKHQQSAIFRTNTRLNFATATFQPQIFCQYRRVNVFSDKIMKSIN
eukprot:TRINITY_DN284_c0_g1_i1.p2 TRINITY_DN284_c0_g1~~TRINITY_DN284_c0_g1_i1.p2  ORF type:complete len:78 (-),score=2.25 TRINITY_DN284_c0_g1_i1:60-293(-)